MAVLLLLIAFVTQSAARPAFPVGDIEFFGAKGLDTVAILKTLPASDGQTYSAAQKEQIRNVVADAIGKEPTDIAAICCDARQRVLLFIGLPGASSRTFTYNAEPTGSARLSPTVTSLGVRLENALEAAVQKGGDRVREDDSRGYALTNDPDARSLQLSLRRYALGHEAELRRVLDSSGDVEQRRIASMALGYARRSNGQIAALVRAARDPDDEVRNNATRALGVLASSSASAARAIPAATFIEMLSSGIWTDRNKGAMVVAQLTASRNPALLSTLRAAALDSLIEMALWREAGHAAFSRIILGRIAGLPEKRLQELAMNGPPQAIVGALGRR